MEAQSSASPAPVHDLLKVSEEYLHICMRAESHKYVMGCDYEDGLTPLAGEGQLATAGVCLMSGVNLGTAPLMLMLTLLLFKSDLN